MLLAGDIGGTKTVLALFSEEHGPHTPFHQATFPSAKYGRLEAIIREFLAGGDYQVTRGCFGVAGPVVNGRAEITNLPWVMDEHNLAEKFGWERVRLLNDLESVAYAVPILEPDDIHTLNEGDKETHGNIAVIAPGTGLGEAFLTWEGQRHRAHASEGGHASFAPSSTRQVALLTYLHNRKGHGHVSFERVCSGGLGIPNIYDFLKEDQGLVEPEWLSRQLAAAAKPTPVIVSAAQNQAEPNELCRETLHLFIQILGAEAGNLALKVLATGGVYIGGGIPPRIFNELSDPKFGFLEKFCAKGRFKDLLGQLPIHVILNANAALLGAAACGLSMAVDA